ncbi:MAG: phage shock protein A [Chloroflexi bacterium]|nr:MAG: phage shock protein A [Chloroflexota bacterium]
MGILERINNILRANINDILDRAEDPEKMLDQIIRDMEAAIRDAKEQVAEMIAQEKMIKRDMERSQELADEWARKAELAVKNGKDQLALEALKRKKDYQEHADVYRQQWEAQKAGVEKLKQELEELESKYDEAKRKKGVLIARRKRAAAQAHVVQTAERLTSIDYGAELERMERRILEEEARAEATTEMAEESIEDQFATMEADDELQQELAALKAKVLGTETSNQ